MNTRHHRNLIGRLLSLLVAVAVVAAACASSESAVTPVDSSESDAESHTSATEPEDAEPEPEPEPEEAEPEPTRTTSTAPVESDDVSDAASAPLDATMADVNAVWPLRLDGVIAPATAGEEAGRDPGLRSGVLDNGVTWYARSNDAPGSSVSLRLAVDAGSVQQDVPESGLAHFVEHMMFNGTETWPGNELDRALQRIGAEIGPDLNAYTSSDETVYQLNLPSNEIETVQIGLQILAEWAGKATLDPAEVIAERGVVREEIRLRDEGAGAPINELFDRVYAAGSAYEGHEVGGDSALILETTQEDVRRFYDRWYRPDNLAVVAVGDIAVETLEKLIIETFDGLEPRVEAPEWESPDVALLSEPVVEVLAVPDASTRFISIDWSVPTSPVGVEGDRRFLVQTLIGEVLRERLTELTASGEADLFDPFVGFFPVNRHQMMLGINVDSPDLLGGTERILAEFASVARDGIDEAAVERSRRAFRSGIEQFRQQSSRTGDGELADRYVANFLSGTSLLSSEQSADLGLELLDEISVAELDAHFQYIMATAAPLVILVADDEADLPTRPELLGAVAAAGAGDRSFADDDVERAEIDHLIDRPEPVEATDVTVSSDIGQPITEWVFGNGTRVLHLFSDIEPEVVYLSAESAGGWSTMEPDDARLMDLVLGGANRSGVGPHDAVTVGRWLGPKSVFISPGIRGTAETFDGQSSSDDVDAMFELLHASIVGPVIEEPALAQARAVALERLSAVESDPVTMVYDRALRLQFGDTEWTRHATTDEVNGLTATRATELYAQRFGKVDDMVVVIVGDISVGRVGELAEQWIGTLPKGPDDSWTDPWPSLPDSVLVDEFDAGEPGSAGAVLLRWLVESDISADDVIAAQVVQQIINTRLFETVREELSVTYGGQVSIVDYHQPREVWESGIFIQGDPERLDEIRDAALDIVEDLRTNGPSQDETDRATLVLQADFNFVDNFYFIDQLLARANGDPVLASFDRVRVLSDVSSANAVQKMVVRLFPPDARIEVIQTPQR